MLWHYWAGVVILYEWEQNESKHFDQIKERIITEIAYHGCTVWAVNHKLTTRIFLIRMQTKTFNIVIKVKCIFNGHEIGMSHCCDPVCRVYMYVNSFIILSEWARFISYIVITLTCIICTASLSKLHLLSKCTTQKCFGVPKCTIQKVFHSEWFCLFMTLLLFFNHFLLFAIHLLFLFFSPKVI